MELRNWAIVRRNTDPYRPPECDPYVLSGEVTGHPGFKDGDQVTTSRAAEVDWENRRIVTASGSEYRLVGPPAVSWSAYLYANGYSVQEYVDLL